RAPSDAKQNFSGLLASTGEHWRRSLLSDQMPRLATHTQNWVPATKMA
ncbi:hypothetical protein A2U01_0060716, partial [Trifolium medium]|nr:hypothetical protein [Trifolium medium]